MTHWYNKKLDDNTVEQFFKELKLFTEEFVVNNAHEMIPSWPLSNILPSHHFDFKPRGAVIHSTGSPFIWNSMHMQARHVFGTHFMVFGGRRMTSQDTKNYPLIAALPASIMMFYPLDALIPHSGFLSTKTWGIDLRNAGRLRPYQKGLQPPPLMPAEINDNNFKASHELVHDVYWRNNLWCDKFPGPSIRCDDYYFEMPTIKQIVTLTVLLRALNHYSGGLDDRLVVPSNCIHGHVPQFPTVIWKLLREQIKLSDTINAHTQWLSYLDKENSEHEVYEIEDEDEGTMAELLDTFRWRAEREDGELDYLENGRNFVLASGYKNIFSYYGYDINDMDYALRMWTIARRYVETQDAEIYSKLNNELPITVQKQ